MALTDERIEDLWYMYNNLSPTDGLISLREFVRAIEVEVRAEAQEPVAWFAFADSNGPMPLELWGFDLKACKNAVLENARSVGWKGTIEGYLFQKGWSIRPLGFIAPQQPPAPCPAPFMTYREERDALQAKVAEQSAEIDRLKTDNERAAFEAWLARACPSGDVESVQSQWLASSDYEEFAIAAQKGGVRC